MRSTEPFWHVMDEAHNHFFFNDFDSVLELQIEKFNFDKFQNFINEFRDYKINDGKNQNAEEFQLLRRLITTYQNYDTLFFCKDYVPSNHPIYQVDGLPFISKIELLDSINQLEKTGWVLINKQALMVYVLLHLKLKFLDALIPGFVNQFVKNIQSNSKRDKVSPNNVKPNTKTAMARKIRDEISADMQGQFGMGSEVWKQMVKTFTNSKDSMRIPYQNEKPPIQIKKGAKKGDCYESMVPMIRLLSPEFKIMSFKEWCDKNDDDDRGVYQTQYLNKRVKAFDGNKNLIG